MIQQVHNLASLRIRLSFTGICLATRFFLFCYFFKVYSTRRQTTYSFRSALCMSNDIHKERLSFSRRGDSAGDRRRHAEKGSDETSSTSTKNNKRERICASPSHRWSLQCRPTTQKVPFRQTKRSGSGHLCASLSQNGIAALTHLLLLSQLDGKEISFRRRLLLARYRLLIRFARSTIRFKRSE